MAKLCGSSPMKLSAEAVPVFRDLAPLAAVNSRLQAESRLRPRQARGRAQCQPAEVAACCAHALRSSAGRGSHRDQKFL